MKANIGGILIEGSPEEFKVLLNGDMAGNKTAEWKAKRAEYMRKWHKKNKKNNGGK